MADEQRARQQARTRTELLDAAMAVFSAKGFAGASIDAIAREAGYTKGAVYANFANKEELFLAVVDRRVEEVTEFHVESTGDETPEMIAKFLRGAFSLEWGMLAVEALLYSVRHSPELRHAFAERNRHFDKVVQASIAEQMAERPAELLEDLAVAQTALTDGLMLRRISDPDCYTPERLGRIVETALTAWGKAETPAGPQDGRPDSSASATEDISDGRAR